MRRLKEHLALLCEEELRQQLRERASSVQDNLAGACLELVCTQGQPAEQAFLHMDVSLSWNLKAKKLPRSTFGKSDRDKAREKQKEKEKMTAAAAAKAAGEPGSMAIRLDSSSSAQKKKSKGGSWFG